MTEFRFHTRAVCFHGLAAIRLLVIVAALLLLAAGAPASAADPATPVFTFAEGSMTVSNVSPNANIYLFGVSREPMQFYSQVVRREVTLTSDGSGVARWSLGPYTWRSIFLAVDLASGRYACGAPSRYRPIQVPHVGDRDLRRDVHGLITHISFTGEQVDFVVVRPGEGAWTALVNYRGRNDEGHDEEAITVPTAKLSPLNDTAAPAPASLQGGDVVFMLDSLNREYSVMKVGE